MTIVAVFLPVGLLPGVAGQYFKHFGLTVVAAVLMSLAVARLITPMLAAYFLAAQWPQKHGEGPLIDTYMRSEEHTSDLQSLMPTSYAVFCLKKQTQITTA